MPKIEDIEGLENLVRGAASDYPEKAADILRKDRKNIIAMAKEISSLRTLARQNRSRMLHAVSKIEDVHSGTASIRHDLPSICESLRSQCKLISYHNTQPL